MTTEKSSLPNTDSILGTPTSSLDGLEPTISGSQDSVQNSQNQQKSIALNLKPLLEIWKGVYKDIQQRGTTPKYPIGLKSVDEVIWGLHKRELLTLGARTSHGKSALALQMAMELADAGQRVVYFSLEMSKEQLVERMLSNFCRIDNRFLRHGAAKGSVEQNSNTFESIIEGLKLLIDDQYGYHFENILDICEIVKPDFIFVDYIQMVSTKGYKNKLEAIEENVRMLKQLANERNMGVVLVSQINREGDKQMSMAHLKGAGVLEEHSDTVILLQWDWENNKYEIRVDKQRHGEVKTVVVDFEPHYFRFKDKPVREVKPNAY